MFDLLIIWSSKSCQFRFIRRGLAPAVGQQPPPGLYQLNGCYSMQMASFVHQQTFEMLKPGSIEERLTAKGNGGGGQQSMVRSKSAPSGPHNFSTV